MQTLFSNFLQEKYVTAPPISPPPPPSRKPFRNNSQFSTSAHTNTEGKVHTRIGRVYVRYTWSVVPRLSPLTGSRTSGPAIFAIYLLLVIGLTGESQAEHKRMLFMDAWKKRRERTGPSCGGNPCSIEPNDFSLLDRFLKCCSQVLRTLFESCCCFNSFLFSNYWRTSFGISRMDEGEIPLIGFDIGWIGFFHDGESGKNLNLLKYRLDLIGRY